jgi:polyphosphate glucokinase
MAKSDRNGQKSDRNGQKGLGRGGGPGTYEDGDREPELASVAEADAQRPLTLAIDIGGTGLKASVLDHAGAMVADRVRVPTTYPMPPAGEGGMVPRLAELVSSLPEADRVSAGFPGMVRNGRVLSAPHFSTQGGPGTPIDPELEKAWRGFDLAEALRAALGKPARVANDADVQGAAVVAGKGLELVITLGTGFGTAVFLEGRLLPHLEIAHQPFRKGETYNEQLGERTRKEIGEDRWNRRVRKAIETLDALLFFDYLYIGGGNARRVSRDRLGDVMKRTTVIDNANGILGGIKLWEGDHLGL